MARRKSFKEDVEPYLDQIVAWVGKGADTEEVARKLGIGSSTLRNWLKLGREGDERYVALADAYTQARVGPDDNVEAALYKSCIGYNAKFIRHYKVRHIEYDPETGKKVSEWDELVPKEDEVHVPANVPAQEFWLTNRRKGIWSYKPDESGGDDDGGGGVILIPEVAQSTEGGGTDG